MLQISFIKLLVIFAIFSLAPYGDCKDDKKDKKDSKENKVKGLVKIDECFGQIIKNSRLEDAGSQCQGEDKKCQMLCQMEKLGLVSNGSLNTDSMNQFVSETYPEESRELINKRINECVEKEGKKKKPVLAKSKNCKDSEKLTKCISKSIKKVCKMGIIIIKDSNSTISSRNSSASTPINNNGNGSNSNSSNMNDQGQMQNSTANNSTDQNQSPPNAQESNFNSTSSSSRVKRDLMTSAWPGQWTTPSSIYNPTAHNPNVVYTYTTGVYRPTTMKRK